ncbi:DUF7352 domain-containing protein [Mycobacteroides chelonae]|uniref:DUF7352 domain-containing protein n=1 Tax=Mycobacteroides chelonae TaxID=1774 RepID=UPI0018B0C5F0|nr:hypothetical protein [Mycobacteroides chelonae]MBF9523062.1 hypothetical protein [Mycobacteroides chelonae]
MRIIRHNLDIADYQTVALPHDGDLLSVAQSRTDRTQLIDLWSLDFEYGQRWTKGIYIVGTGNSMPEQLRDSAYKRDRREQDRAHPGFVYDYGVPEDDPKPWRHFIGTVVTPCGLVWHVFEGPVQ